MKALILLISLLLLTVINTFAQDGAPDPAFGGGDGMVINSIVNNEKSWGYGVAVQMDRKIVVTGNTIAGDGYEHPFLARYHEDGTLDNSFNGTGKLVLDLSAEHSYGREVKIQPDGKIVICAESEDSTGLKAWILRFNENGIPDNTFNGDGRFYLTVGSQYLGMKALTFQPDGKILVGGYTGGLVRDSFFIIRIMPNGTLDNSFDGDGIVKTIVGESYVNLSALLVQADEKIVAIGNGIYNGNEDFALARYHSNGSLDHSFSGDGIAHITFSDGDDRAKSGLIQPDGKIVIAGYAINVVSNRNDFAIARFKTDGTLDDSFHGTGMALINLTEYSDAAYSLLKQPDGKYVMGGYAHSDAAAGGSALALVRLNQDGTFDNAFDEDGIYTFVHPELTSNINSSVMQSDGKIISVGTCKDAELNQVILFRSLTGLTTATQDVDDMLAAVAIHPNPVSERLVLNYSLEKSAQLQITICDVMGRTIDHLLNKVERSAGNHEEQLELNKALATGLYFVKIETAAGVKAFPFLKE